MAKSKKIERKAEQIAEIKRCGTDPVYFIKKYVKISHPTRGPIPFQTYLYQEECLKDFLEHRLIICNKSRQLGLSTISAAYSLWMAIFRREKNILIIATKLDTAKLFLRKVKGMYDSLPEWLVMPTLEGESVKELRFSNGSVVKAIPTAVDAGRGEAVSLLIVDEAAHIDDFDDLWTGLQPMLSCVSGDTLVLTDEGFVKIEDLHTGKNTGDYFEMEVSVFGKNGLEKTSHGYVSPNHETYIITTKMGYQVEVTPIHPLYKLTASGVGMMAQAQDLKIGDSLRLQIGMSQFGKTVMSDDVAYMLGGYTAEGWITKTKTKTGIKNYSIEIENTDPEFRSVFINSTETKPFHVVPSRSSRLRCSSIEVVNKFKSLGINPNHYCYQKEVPQAVLRGTKKVVSNYLSGLFDGDGCASDRGITLSTTSNTLARQVQLLLGNFGFVANISNIEADQSKIGTMILPQGKTLQSIRNSWQVQIPLSQSGKFVTEIGFRIARKQNKALLLAEQTTQDDFGHFSVNKINIKNWFQNLLEKTGKSVLWFRERGCRLDKLLDNNDNRKITQRLIEDFWNLVVEAGVIPTACEHAVLKEVVGSFTWDDIVSIRKSHNKTYDFTVPETHTFLQNGILGSNTGGNCILISSPKGVGNQFYNIWKAATNTQGSNGEKMEGSNEFWAIELPWQVHPEHDQKWFESQCANLLNNPRAIAQELLCSFEASGFSFLDKDSITHLANTVESPAARFGSKLEMDIWKHPENGHKYIISADVARGDADDYSACHVIDVSVRPADVCAEYKGKIQPDRFAEFLVDIAKKYNNAFIVHEMNSAGIATSYKLKETKYPYVYYADLFDKDLYKTYLETEILDKIPGFTTSVKTRPDILVKLEGAIRNRSIRCRSRRLVDEFTTFVVQGDKPKAQKNCHDDLVMSLAIGCAFIEYGQVSNNSNEFAMAMLKAMSKDTKTLGNNKPNTGFGVQGHDLPTRSSWGSTRQTPQENVTMYQSLDWLLRDK